MASQIRLDLRFVAKENIISDTFDAVKVINLATKQKSYTPTIINQPLNISWSTKSAAINYAKRVFNRYQRLLKAQTNAKNTRPEPME